MGVYEEVPAKASKTKKKVPDGYIDASHPTQSTRNLLAEEEPAPILKRKRKKRKLLINLHYT